MDNVTILVEPLSYPSRLRTRCRHPFTNEKFVHKLTERKFVTPETLIVNAPGIETIQKPCIFYFWHAQRTRI